MRSKLYVISAFAVILSAFLIYMKVIAKPSAQGIDAANNDPTPPSQDTGASIYDVRRGDRLFSLSDKNQFQAKEYTPHEDGTITVIEPEAWFFMANHQRMRVTGPTGEVYMEDSGPSGKGQRMSGGSGLSHGVIHHAKIELFNLFGDSKPTIPDETITTENLQFDNATMLITSKGAPTCPMTRCRSI